jgi:hypothetical protein
MGQVFILKQSNSMDELLTDLSDKAQGLSWIVTIDQWNNWRNHQSKFSTLTPMLILLAVDRTTVLEKELHHFDFPFTVLVDYPLLPLLEQEKLRELTEKYLQIQDIVDVSRGIDLHWPLWRSQMKKMEQTKKDFDSMKEMGQEINRQVGQSLLELQRIKKFHEQIVPVRKKKTKGLEIVCKYAAGERSGGDFFDFVTSDQEILLLMTSTSSYVMSSLVLSHFEVWREKKHFDDEVLKNFLTAIFDEIQRLNLAPTSGQKNLHMLLARIRMKSMQFSGYIFGGHEIFSDHGHYFLGNQYPPDRNFLEQSSFDLQLHRGEKLLILSPGIRQNFGNLIEGRDLVDFFRDQFHKRPVEILNELFFQLKKNVQGDFLKHDASAIFVGVDKNAIIQV